MEIVPNNKCLLNVLVEKGERIKNSWIFVNKDLIDKLSRSADTITPLKTGTRLFFKATDILPEKTLTIEHFKGSWFQIISIRAEDIAYTDLVDDPDDILSFKSA